MHKSDAVAPSDSPKAISKSSSKASLIKRRQKKLIYSGFFFCLNS